MHKPSPALIVALLSLFVALGGVGVAATGGNFILGQSNTATSTSSLSASVGGAKALQLSNTNTAAGSTALGLNVAPGHAPLSVNSGAKVTNLNADQLDNHDSTYFLPKTAKAADADKLDGIDSTGFARAKKLTWTPAPLLSNQFTTWVNYGPGWSTAAYTKDPSGIVHLKGLVTCVPNDFTGCAAIDEIFTLPAGYRPAENSVFATLSNNMIGRITIASDGQVIAEIGQPQEWISLEGITFPAA
jgi:hypothetical protein